MKNAVKAGFSFGVVSGIITTIGLIIGLTESGASRSIVVGGILTIAFADAFSDALGIHISYESQSGKKFIEIWQSTISTFFAKLIIASTFLIPIILFSLNTGLIVSVIWSLLLLSVLSYYVALYGNEKPWKVISEHVIIAIVVVLITYYIGKVINLRFN